MLKKTTTKKTLAYLCVICSPGKPWVVWFPRIFKVIWLMHLLSCPGNEPSTSNKAVSDRKTSRCLDQTQSHVEGINEGFGKWWQKIIIKRVFFHLCKQVQPLQWNFLLLISAEPDWIQGWPPLSRAPACPGETRHFVKVLKFQLLSFLWHQKMETTHLYKELLGPRI